ncbi:uncharacterized protein LOC144092156 isoform X2 [Stigmatopora argus]
MMMMMHHPSLKSKVTRRSNLIHKKNQQTPRVFSDTGKREECPERPECAEQPSSLFVLGEEEWKRRRRGSKGRMRCATWTERVPVKGGATIETSAGDKFVYRQPFYLSL